MKITTAYSGFASLEFGVNQIIQSRAGHLLWTYFWRSFPIFPQEIDMFAAYNLKKLVILRPINYLNKNQDFLLRG